MNCIWILLLLSCCGGNHGCNANNKCEHNHCVCDRVERCERNCERTCERSCERACERACEERCENRCENNCENVYDRNSGCSDRIASVRPDFRPYDSCGCDNQDKRVK